MLSRLKIKVNKYITAYNKLVEAVFRKKLSSLLFNIKSKVKPRFDLAKLDKAVRKVV